MNTLPAAVYQMDPAISCPDPDAARLVTTAYETIRRRYVEGRHQIAAAIIAADNRMYVGVHLEAMVGCYSMCAERAALAAARLCTDQPLLGIAAVRYPKPSEGGPARIVSPCGGCRELVLDYAPNIRVVVPREGQGLLLPLAELLPDKYTGTKWAAEPQQLPTPQRPVVER
ncbi:hypothetical protein OG455_27450 [Kitasatospora sp. NBC_01287]|uniref:hypothetical protein n=1 Tax=Kitasatospora sp. NBC_01287 TaxID=2903573 RepID=UPI00224F7D08|nr:hypothetical protein [Kitasatospora sp. NBC_01287]MCX4749196.1 hypothetical protein [Kitasatospora sp. NBC_01287]